MNRRVLPFFLLLLAWFALGFWLCKKFLCNAAPAATISQASIAPAKTSAWIFNDGNNFSAESPDYFGFAKSSATHLGLGAGLQTAVASAATYLKGNANRSLDITGYYLDSEKNNSILPSLGIARANDIKELFVANGVPSNQLNLKDALLPETSWANATSVTRGIDLDFSAKAAVDTRLEGIQTRLVGKPLTFYFATGQDNIDISNQQRTDMADMLYYLDRVEAGKIEISGHTDSKGRRSANLNLSKDRAQSVLDYLGKNGLAADRMTSEGFGPDKPIASNDNADGRAKNRRVEVVLK